MDTPMILTAADRSSDGTNPEQIKPRGRKSSKGLNQKKQPQRGLGVPQLERLRLQEQWKKMTEVQIQIQSSPPLQFAGPLSGVPVQCCPGNYDGREMIASNGGLGFSYGSLMIGGLAMADQLQNGFEDQNMKELSSIPKTKCVSNHCDFCLKKKLFNGRNVGLNEEKDKNNEISNINGSDSLGLNISNIPNPNKGAEIKRIHRKGSSVDGSFLMEYEFFPRKSDTYFRAEEASCIVTSSSSHGGPSSTAPVDLSLKLSF